MKKTILMFAALAVTFLMSADLYSAGNNERGVMYCVYDNWGGYCFKHFDGIACYGVDANCNWINPDIPEEDND